MRGISLGKASGAQQENDKSHSGGSGKSLSKWHSGSHVSTYTMRDEPLRSNQELTFGAALEEIWYRYQQRTQALPKKIPICSSVDTASAEP